MHTRLLIFLLLLFASLTKAQWHNESRYPTGSSSSIAYDQDNDNLYILTSSELYPSSNRSDRNRQSQLWIWTKDEWMLVNDQVPGGYSSVLQYDPVQKKIILFSSGVNLEVWILENRRWKKISHRGPEARVAFAVAYNPSILAFVVFGGASSDRDNFRVFRDTWTWNGRKWKLINTDGPHYEGIGSADMIFSDKLNSMVMFVPYINGSGTYVFKNDEWKYVSDPYNYDLRIYGICRYNNNIFVISRPDREYGKWYEHVGYKIYKLGLRDMKETKWDNINWNDFVNIDYHDSITGFTIYNDTIIMHCGSNGKTLFKYNNGELINGYYKLKYPRYFDSIKFIAQNIYENYNMIYYGSVYYIVNNYKLTAVAGELNEYRLIDAVFDHHNNRTYFLGRKWRPYRHPEYTLYEWDGENWEEKDSKGLDPGVMSGRTSDALFLHIDDTQDRLFLVAFPWIWNRVENRGHYEGLVMEYDGESWQMIHNIPTALIDSTYIYHFASAITNQSKMLLVSSKMTTQEIDLQEGCSDIPIVYDKFNRRSNIVEDLEGNYAVFAGKVRDISKTDEAGNRDVRFWYWKDKTWQPGIKVPTQVKISKTSLWRDYIRNRIVSAYSFFQVWSYGPYPGPNSGERCLENNQFSGNTLIFDSSTNNYYTRNQELNGSLSLGVLPFTADLDGDGKATIGIFDPARGNVYVRGYNQPIALGQLGDQPVIGDYNGDGRDEVVLYRPITGEWLSTSGVIATLGTAYDTPVKGDYNGDGAVEPAVYNAESGTWRFLDGSTIQLGNADSWPVPADYDGDGITDIAVWNKRTGEWQDEDGVFASFGYLQDLPAPGDYNGDGKAEPALYRPGTGEWIINGVVLHKTAKWCVPVW